MAATSWAESMQSYVVGIDEAGRGCWAGPLVAAATALASPVAGVRDSKKMTRLSRQKYDSIIRSQALALGVGWVFPAEIDVLGLTAAVRLAMIRALYNLYTTYPAYSYNEIIIDGSYNFLQSRIDCENLCRAYLPPASNLRAVLPDTVHAHAMVRADDSVPAVSAASVIAKVARDAYMITQASVYSEYGFEQHVGYGTANHKVALDNFGPTPLHRLSFRPLKK